MSSLPQSPSERVPRQMPPPPPPEAYETVVPIFQRRRTLIEEPHVAAKDAAESTVTCSFLQGALFTCSFSAAWVAYGIASADRSTILGGAAALLSVTLALVAFRAGRRAANAAKRLVATGSEPRHAEIVASREGMRDLIVVRIAAALTPAYAVSAIIDLQPASLPLMAAAALFAGTAIILARRVAERVGSARYATRVMGFRENRGN